MHYKLGIVTIALVCFSFAACKSQPQSASQVASDGTQAEVRETAPYEFKRVQSKRHRLLEKYKDRGIEGHLAFKRYYTDMFESTWYASDGYSVDLSRDGFANVAAGEAQRRFSPVDVAQLKAGLTRELRSLQSAKEPLSAQIAETRQAMKSRVSTSQDPNGFGPTIDWLNPTIDTEDESYWDGREYSAKRSSEYRDMSAKLSELSEEREAARIREGRLRALLSRL